MEYYKLKISLRKYEEKLNRTILFERYSNLDELVCLIFLMFNLTPCTSYKFKDYNKIYECEINMLIEEHLDNDCTKADTWLTTIDQLDLIRNKFLMIYNGIRQYKFIIEVLEKVELEEEYPYGIVIDGNGTGVVQEEIKLYKSYLNEKPQPLQIINGVPPHLNFDPFDVDSCNEKLKEELPKIRRASHVILF